VVKDTIVHKLIKLLADYLGIESELYEKQFYSDCCMLKFFPEKLHSNVRIVSLYCCMTGSINISDSRNTKVT